MHANKMAETKAKDAKKVDEAETDEPRPDYEVLASRITLISKPLASRKLTKKLYKVVKKGEL